MPVHHRSFRSSSGICKPGLSTSALEVVPSLPGLGSFRVKITSLLGSEFPLPLCSALFYLLDVILTIHRGLTKNVGLLFGDWICSIIYLHTCTHSRIWLGKLYIVMILSCFFKCFKNTQIIDSFIFLSWCWSMLVFIVQLSHPPGLCAGLPAVMCRSNALCVSCQCLDFAPWALRSLSDTSAG